MDDLACFRRQMESTICTFITEENISKLSEGARKEFKVGDRFITYFKQCEERHQTVISVRSTNLETAYEETKDKKFVGYEGVYPIFKF